MKTLIIFAHTFWEDSKVNKALFESIKNSKQVQIHNLSEYFFFLLRKKAHWFLPHYKVKIPRLASLKRIRD